MTPEDTIALSKTLAASATEMTDHVVARADQDRVGRAIGTFSAGLGPDGNNSDGIMALAVMLAVHGRRMATETGQHYMACATTIAAVLVKIAEHTRTIEVPPDGERH